MKSKVISDDSSNSCNDKTTRVFPSFIKIFTDDISFYKKKKNNIYH